MRSVSQLQAGSNLLQYSCFLALPVLDLTLCNKDYLSMHTEEQLRMFHRICYQKLCEPREHSSTWVDLSEGFVRIPNYLPTKVAQINHLITLMGHDVDVCQYSFCASTVSHADLALQYSKIRSEFSQLELLFREEPDFHGSELTLRQALTHFAAGLRHLPIILVNPTYPVAMSEGKYLHYSKVFYKLCQSLLIIARRTQSLDIDYSKPLPSYQMICKNVFEECLFSLHHLLRVREHMRLACPDNLRQRLYDADTEICLDGIKKIMSRFRVPGNLKVQDWDFEARCQAVQQVIETTGSQSGYADLALTILLLQRGFITIPPTHVKLFRTNSDSTWLVESIRDRWNSLGCFENCDAPENIVRLSSTQQSSVASMKRRNSDNSRDPMSKRKFGGDTLSLDQVHSVKESGAVERNLTTESDTKIQEDDSERSKSSITNSSSPRSATGPEQAEIDFVNQFLTAEIVPSIESADEFDGLSLMGHVDLSAESLNFPFSDRVTKKIQDYERAVSAQLRDCPIRFFD